MQYSAGSQQQLHVWQGFLKGNFRTSHDFHPVIECRVLPHKWIVCASRPFCSYFCESQLWVTHNLYVHCMEALAADIEMLIMVRRQYWYLCAIHTPHNIRYISHLPKILHNFGEVWLLDRNIIPGPWPSMQLLLRRQWSIVRQMAGWCHASRRHPSAYNPWHIKAQRRQYLSRHCQWMRTVGDTLYVPLDDVAQLHDGVAWQSVASHELRVHQCFQRTCCVAMVLLLNLLCLSVSHKLCTKYLLHGQLVSVCLFMDCCW